MDPKRHAVGPLFKVDLQVCDGSGMLLGRVVWIVGLDRQGLTAFEERLIGMRTGDEVAIDTSGAATDEAFGPLGCNMASYASAADGRITVRILAVVPAESREVIKWLADQTACGGCECCGH
jgi:hypothetical protein